MGTRKHNVAIGIMAGGVSTAGSGNIYLGCYAGYCNGGGGVNVYISRKAGYWNKTGHDNVMIGDCAGLEVPPMLQIRIVTSSSVSMQVILIRVNLTLQLVVKQDVILVRVLEILY